jgi:hypothetical protein
MLSDGKLNRSKSMHQHYTMVLVVFAFHQTMGQLLYLLEQLVGQIGYFQMVKQIFIHLHPVA